MGFVGNMTKSVGWTKARKAEKRKVANSKRKSDRSKKSKEEGMRENYSFAENFKDQMIFFDANGDD